MTRRFNLANALSRFRRSRRSNVLLMTALMATVLMYSVGVAVDYMRAVQFRSTLQNTVDAAALAGATAYTSCASGTASGGVVNAQNIATNVFNATALPWHIGSVALTANGSTTGSSPCSAGTGNPTAYQMTVTASNVPIPTTFLSLIQPSMAISATATATNPVVTATANAAGWGSSAYDANLIYVYPIPSDGSLPSFPGGGTIGSLASPNATVTNSQGVKFTFLFSNLASSNGSYTLNFAVSQKVGFMMYNVSNGKYCYVERSGGNPVSTGSVNAAQTKCVNSSDSGQYRPNQAPGSVHQFYSQSNNPNSATTMADGTTTGGYNSGYNNHGSSTVQNCSMQVITTFRAADGTTRPVTVENINALVYPNNSGVSNYNAPITGNCYGNTVQPFVAMSCQELAGQAVFYEFNDMGGHTDDYDYNDAEFGFYCGSGAGSPGTVHLIN